MATPVTVPMATEKLCKEAVTKLKDAYKQMQSVELCRSWRMSSGSLKSQLSFRLADAPEPRADEARARGRARADGASLRRGILIGLSNPRKDGMAFRSWLCLAGAVKA